MMTTGLKSGLLHAGSSQIHWDAVKILKSESQSCVRRGSDSESSSEERWKGSLKKHKVIFKVITAQTQHAA